jgi:hypothetical protein
MLTISATVRSGSAVIRKTMAIVARHSGRPSAAAGSAA